MSSSFFYFGFGSNMLAKRIHLQNPSARRIGAGKLENFRLDFYSNTSRWRGAPATIVPHEGEEVYGAIWEIDMENLKDLDNQEGVSAGVYRPISVPVWHLEQQTHIICRAYHLENQPEAPLKELHPASVPPDRKPSLTYLKTLIKGALESDIPQHYVQWLYSVNHNAALAHDMEKLLNLDIDLDNSSICAV